VSAAGLVVPFDEAELTKVKSALNVLIDAYEAMAAKEQNIGEKVSLDNYARAGEALLARFRAPLLSLDGSGHVTHHEEPLSPGDLSVLERALRMSANKWASMIRLEMPKEEKDANRAEAQKASDLLTKLRQARGLPW
jgi:hypothetical protein